MLQTADGGLESSHSVLQKMRSLAVQASTGTLTDSDRQYINREFEELKSVLNDVAFNTKFNNQMLLGPTAKPQADIVFLFDKSGSCNGQIASIAAQLVGWVEELSETFSDIRLGVAYYGTNSNLFLDLTTDVSKVITAINQVASGAGGGYFAPGGSEFIYNGINTAVNNASWNQGNDKFIIGLTDAGAEDEEIANDPGQTKRAAALTALLSKNIIYNSIDPGGNVGGGIWTEHFSGYDTQYNGVTYNEDQEYDYLTTATNGLRGTFSDINLALTQIKNNIKSNASFQMGDPFSFHISYTSKSFYESVLPYDARPSALSVANCTLNSIIEAQNSIANIDSAISTVSLIRAVICAEYNMLESQMNINMTNFENFTSAISKIGDTDIAGNSISLTKNKIMEKVKLNAIKNVNLYLETSIDQLRQSAI